VAAAEGRDITEYHDWIKYLEQNTAGSGSHGLWREAGGALLTGLGRGRN